MNPNAIKDRRSGKFLTTNPIQTKEPTDREFILMVKASLYEGMLDIDAIKLAYKMIVGHDTPMNMRMMKSTITNYQ